MVVIPAGRFNRGAPATESGSQANERPVANVRFARSFAIGQYEVTFADWDRYVNSQTPRPYNPTAPGGRRGKRPVVLVSWNDVTRATTGYLAWLSRQTGNTYRLPSEAEWEYATRAGTTTAYHFGNDITNCSLANYARSISGTAPLSRDCNPPIVNADGSSTWTAKSAVDVDTGYSPNTWGLWHVHGNVSELVQDCYFSTHTGAFNDGRPRREPFLGCTTGRVLRGSSWIYQKSYQRSAKRAAIPPGDSGRSNTVGFRVAQDLN